MSENTLRLTNISKSFAGVHALRGVQFDLRSGEVHALLGENGAGKSTLVKVITGVHQPDTGEIYLNGRRIHLAVLAKWLSTKPCLRSCLEQVPRGC